MTFDGWLELGKEVGISIVVIVALVLIFTGFAAKFSPQKEKDPGDVEIKPEREAMTMWEINAQRRREIRERMAL